ncbi:MAG: VOC family protein [Gemmatimonadota bacterium]|nr:VOC family protein [Gemmatimonadota bacterium]
MINTRGMTHIALPVKDPRESARFYSSLFNMEVLSCTAETAFLKTAGSGDLLAFGRSDIRVASSRDSMHFGFVIDPEQFDAAVRTIEERSINKLSEPGRRNIGRYIFIEDPDGYAVEIFENLESAW